MNSLEPCCFCLSASNTASKNLFKKNIDGSSLFDKVSSCFSQLANVLNENSDCRFNLCDNCCDTIEMINRFNKTWLQNVNIYVKYKGNVKVKMIIEQCDPTIVLPNIKSEPISNSAINLLNNMEDDINIEENHIYKINEEHDIKSEKLSSPEKNLVENYFEEVLIEDNFQIENSLTDNSEAEVEEENEIGEPANAEVKDLTSFNQINETSKKKYSTAYENFMDWKRKKNYDSFSEFVLLEYFNELSTKFKPTSLWNYYSMLRCTLNINHGINIENYKELKNLLKKYSKGFHPKQAETFTPENLKDFLTRAPDNTYLATKIALIMGVFGACRTNEMYNMKLQDFQDLGTTFFVKIKAKKARQFIVPEKFYHLFKKYIECRPLSNDYFFLNYQKGRCNSQRIGINKLSKLGKEIAFYLELPNPENYSCVSFRKSFANILNSVNEEGSLSCITSLCK